MHRCRTPGCCQSGTTAGWESELVMGSSPDRLTNRRTDAWLFGAVALPTLCLALAALYTVVAGILGVHPLWRSPELNMSEAAAMRDPATVVRMLRDGADEGLRREVRRGLLFDESVSLTPLEAAIAARRSEIASLLIARRPLGVEEWSHLKCLVASIPDGGVERLIDGHRPEAAASMPDCSRDTVPWDGLSRR